MYFKYIFQKFLRNIARVKLRVVLTTALAHGIMSYWMMKAANEADLVASPIEFFYFWVVTSSTVGYGDASPTTEAGMLISALFMIPFSLGLFGVLLTKASATLIEILRREMTGMKDFSNAQDHILMLGYQAQRTKEMIELILADKHRANRMILVVTDQDIEHPFLDIDGVEFCRVESMTHDETFSRIALTNAVKIVVDLGDDSESYVLSTLCAARNKACDVVTYIIDTNISTSLQAQYENIEVIQDSSEEMIVRALQDPGSSQTINQLMRADTGQTIYVTAFTPKKDINVNDVIEGLSQTHNALLMGIANNRRGSALELNVRDRILEAGKPLFLHYMHTRRLSTQDIEMAS